MGIISQFWSNFMLAKAQKFIGLSLISLLLAINVSAMEHQHQATVMIEHKPCASANIICAQTVTSAFAPNGDLWRLWSFKQSL